MKLPRFLLLVFSCWAVAHATTVIAPSFDELVKDSELIFRGRVTAVKSDWAGEGKGRHLATWVTFAVERTLRGSVAATITLEFAGGEAGTKRLRLAGWPEFAVGDRGVFFVELRDGRVCPLMRLRHGKYRIAGEGATERVLRDDGTPLRAVADVARPLGEAVVAGGATTAATLTLAEFETQVTARSAELPRTEAVAR